MGFLHTVSEVMDAGTSRQHFHVQLIDQLTNHMHVNWAVTLVWNQHVRTALPQEVSGIQSLIQFNNSSKTMAKCVFASSNIF